MSDWWQAFSAEWSWSDPMLLIGIITAAVTALIPVVLWRMSARQAKHDSDQNKLQTDSLARQEQISGRERRDSLLEIVGRSADATHLGLLWREVREYQGEDRELLLTVFRANAALALPGTSTGVKVQDDLTDTIVSHYVGGLERRYTEGARGFHPYSGLLDFIMAAMNQGAKIETSKIVALVTGPTSENQRPSHGFYRDLVNALPGSAGGLLREVESIDFRSSGGLRLNVLTGTLLAVKDVEMGRPQRYSSVHVDAVEELKSTVPEALASLLHRDNLRSFDRWSLEGSTEPVSATVAWLIRAVGWLSDTNNHLAMRMVQNLAAAIESIPAAERCWGIDDRDVRQGFEWIKRKQPTLWKTYGAGLESSATSIGPWKAEDHDNV